MPVFLGDCILDDEDEVAEYISFLTGYAYEDIIKADDTFIKRLNARMLAIKFDRASDIATRALLTSIADKKRAGKNSKPFTIEELLGFQGIDRKNFRDTLKVYNDLIEDAREKEQKAQHEQAKAKKAKAETSIAKKVAKWRGLGNRTK
ncbi:hypothetical protein [Enterococcus termitis]|uniref:Uncharacterized protein n=1 Tax=Enterococcus termitis TaxID=332950 RepID=A0A1E5GZJ2_9ENTE|nr:hypothetical protein [Enterococcus termitis]OEG18144.1 hypothetical protein BCR25_16760 [Enterococcus termitis]OJG97177.1 hypothetical protein RV18_GL001042 [Enterococcus termitis]